MYPRSVHLLLPVVVFIMAACSKENDAIATERDSTAATPADTMQPPRGVELASIAGRFSIIMPTGFSNPREGALPLVTAEDTTMMTAFTAVRDTSTAFIIAYTDVRKGDVAIDQGQVFDVARDATLRNIGGTLERQESRTLNGHPGRSIFFSGRLDGTAYHGRADYYLALPRLYQIYYISSDGTGVSSPEVESAFRSFTIQDSMRLDSAQSGATVRN